MGVMWPFSASLNPNRLNSLFDLGKDVTEVLSLDKSWKAVIEHLNARIYYKDSIVLFVVKNSITTFEMQEKFWLSTNNYLTIPENIQSILLLKG